MDAFAQSSVEDRRFAFEQAAAAKQLSPQIVEKDFWVCWTLKRLFALPTIGEHLIFKGGTSLSKIFKVIERFSEDIDVSIDRGFLGFGGDNEPEAGGSNKEKQRRIDALRVACQQKIANELQPAMDAVIKSKVRSGEKWSLRADATDPDGQTLLFDYPSAWPVAGAAYVRQTVKIEMGARADHWPCEAKPITPYVAEEFPQAFKETICIVKVLSAERTFWEKATILHAEFHRPADKAMTGTKQKDTRARYITAWADHAFDLIRDLPLIETRADHILKVLRTGTVSTNVYLRRMHNFALDMNWLPKSLVPRRQWPKPVFKPKRAITLAEHEAIVARETNPERRAFYQLAWQLGAAQTDLAMLTAEDVDWESKVISFFRRKTRSVARLHFGAGVAAILQDLPSEAEGRIADLYREVEAEDFRALDELFTCVPTVFSDVEAFRESRRLDYDYYHILQAFLGATPEQKQKSMDLFQRITQKSGGDVEDETWSIWFRQGKIGTGKIGTGSSPEDLIKLLEKLDQMMNFE